MIPERSFLVESLLLPKIRGPPSVIRTPEHRAGRSAGGGSPTHLAKGIPSSVVSPAWLPTRSWTRSSGDLTRGWLPR